MNSFMQLLHFISYLIPSYYFYAFGLNWFSNGFSKMGHLCQWILKRKFFWLIACHIKIDNCVESLKQGPKCHPQISDFLVEPFGNQGIRCNKIYRPELQQSRSSVNFNNIFFLDRNSQSHLICNRHLTSKFVNKRTRKGGLQIFSIHIYD